MKSDATGQTGTTARKTGKRGDEQTKSLQEQAFLLNVVGGKSCREIAAILGIGKNTASQYIRAESERRAAEIAADRKKLQADSVAFYDEIAAKGVALAEKADGAFMQPLIKGLDSALKARERRDKILGLDAPTKIDLGLKDLLQAFEDTSGDSGTDTSLP